MREWLESLSAEARETLGSELLEALRRKGALSHAQSAEESAPFSMQMGFGAAAMAERGLHNSIWLESGSVDAAVEERAFSEARLSPARWLGQRTEEHTGGQDALETFSRRLEREDRRYDNGFPANA